jgi:hypothetical protein
MQMKGHKADVTNAAGIVVTSAGLAGADTEAIRCLRCIL